MVPLLPPRLDSYLYSTLPHLYYSGRYPLCGPPPPPPSSSTMSNPTPAQEEFANLFANSTDDHSRTHPEDRGDAAYHNSGDEEDRYRASQIDAAMRMPTLDGAPGVVDIKLPPASFDAGRTTGVKGVIADARAYENARRSKWKDRVRAARQSVFGISEAKSQGRGSDLDSEGSGADDPDEEAFLEQWRESRRRELESETAKGPIRNRRTSPSVRIYGRLDEVDALGYLDAIEKVGRETVVAVFVYDNEVSWSCRYCCSHLRSKTDILYSARYRPWLSRPS